MSKIFFDFKLTTSNITSCWRNTFFRFLNANIAWYSNNFNKWLFNLLMLSRLFATILHLDAYLLEPFLALGIGLMRQLSIVFCIVLALVYLSSCTWCSGCSSRMATRHSLLKRFFFVKISFAIWYVNRSRQIFIALDINRISFLCQ